MSDRLSIEEIAQLADIAASRGVTIRIFPSGKVEIIAPLPEKVTSVTNGNAVTMSPTERNAEKQRRYRERRKSEAEKPAVTQVTTLPEKVTSEISPPPPLSLSPSPSPSLPPPPSPTPPSSPAHTPAPPPTHPHTPTPALNRGQAHAHTREADAAESPDSGATGTASESPGELTLGDPLRFRTNRRDSQPKPTAAQQRRIEAERTAAIGGIPPELDTTAFAEAWAEWNAYRADLAEADKRKPWTPRAASAALRLCADAGADAAVTEIRRAIAAGWTGIHFHERPIYRHPRPDPSPINGNRHPTGMPDPFAPIDWNNPKPGDPHYWEKTPTQTATN